MKKSFDYKPYSISITEISNEWHIKVLNKEEKPLNSNICPILSDAKLWVSSNYAIEPQIIPLTKSTFRSVSSYFQD